MKPKFKLEDYKGKYAMHCNTKEKANIFCSFLSKHGREWASSRIYLDTNYNVHGDDTVYSLNRGICSGRSFFEENGYTILKFDDFDWSNDMEDKQYELKPCPHCGNATTVHIHSDVSGEYRVICPYTYCGCGCSGTARRTKDEAVECWNRRPDDNKSQFEKLCDLLGMEKGKLYIVTNCVSEYSAVYRISKDDETIEKTMVKNINCDRWETVSIELYDLLEDDCKVKEYTPIKQPTEKDIEIMKAFKVLYGYKWFACDADGDVWAFVSKPKKMDVWYPLDCKGHILTEKSLSHISWEDSEPYYFEE